MTADQLRETFLAFFESRGHRRFPSLPLIPTHPAAPLFTNSGMVRFFPVFFGEEPSTVDRATTCQKCLRVRGKHDDIENVGRTTRHLTFFEMLGNFSFGDYFKAGAIEYAWQFLTEVLGLEAERLWVTVHDSDDEANRLWQELVGIPQTRIQRTGEDNFWEMGPTGPCGPSSEIFYDKGREFGVDGGPVGGGEERFVELWNLVFTSLNRLEDGSLEPLPRRNIDTGAGLERVLPVLEGVTSVFDAGPLRELVLRASELTGATYGRTEDADISLRILADHSRAMTFLLADGTVPSNEERGYVLRRIIRRAVRHAQRLGADHGVLADLASAVVETMGGGYPELAPELDRISQTLEREEHRFLDTLTVGLAMLSGTVGGETREISAETAFKLHDTYGFPIELTREIATEHGLTVDLAGFERAMARQRERARLAAASTVAERPGSEDAHRVLTEHGPTTFVGYDQLKTSATVLAVERLGPDLLGVFTDRTPFYAESGGQVGDTGAISGVSGQGTVLDTDSPIGGVVRHVLGMVTGDVTVGETVELTVDVGRRAALARAQTATHLLHWALRSVAGSQLHQQGSLVSPDALRFDYNHHAPLTVDQLRDVETLVSEQILGGHAVHVDDMSLSDARASGALSFFGEKYGERVRVVTAGDSVELCGGTHVSALGQIGEFLISAQSSIGSNLRRIEALVGTDAHHQNWRERETLREAAHLLRVPVGDVVEAVSKLHAEQQDALRVSRELAGQLDGERAEALVAAAADGVVVSRYDGRDQQALRELAVAIQARPSIVSVALIGSPDRESVALAVALDPQRGDARRVARAAAAVVSGGAGGSNNHVAVGGGRDPDRIPAAIDVLRSQLTNSGEHA